VRNEQQLGTQGRLLVAVADPAGAVDSYGHKISYEINLADATTIADRTPPVELVPNPLDKNVYRAVSRTVAQKAIQQGLERVEFITYEEE
jgi:malic enzyme